MTSYRIRPRFKQFSQQNIEEIGDEFKSTLNNNEDCVGQIAYNLITLKIPQKDRHFWSPELSVSLEETEDGTIIRGLYGPNPTVWTFFMFAYSCTGILALFTLMIASVNITLGRGYFYMIIFFVFLFLGLGIYLIAQFGQKMGVEQTFTLHHFFESVIHEKVHIK